MHKKLKHNFQLSTVESEYLNLDFVKTMQADSWWGRFFCHYQEKWDENSLCSNYRLLSSLNNHL